MLAVGALVGVMNGLGKMVVIRPVPRAKSTVPCGSPTTVLTLVTLPVVPTLVGGFPIRKPSTWAPVVSATKMAWDVGSVTIPDKASVFVLNAKGAAENTESAAVAGATLKAPNFLLVGLLLNRSFPVLSAARIVLAAIPAVGEPVPVARTPVALLAVKPEMLLEPLFAAKTLDGPMAGAAVPE